MRFIILTLLAATAFLAAVFFGRWLGRSIAAKRNGEKMPLGRTILLGIIFLALAVAMFFMQSCAPKTEQTMENPLLSEWNDRFGVPPFDRIKAEHFAPALEQAMSLHNAEIDAIVNNNDEPTFENTVLAYDNSGKLLERVELCFGMLCAAETNEQMQAVEQSMSPRLTAHSGAIMMNDGLFERVKSVYERRGALGLDSLQIRLTEKLYRRFVRGGALLSPEDKEQLRKVDEELSTARVKYAANLLAANSGFEMVISDIDDLDGLPASSRDAAAAEAKSRGMSGKWVFTTKKPSMLPFLTYSSKRELREKLYRGYLDRCNYNDSIDNKQVINDIVRLCTERAHLLGYPTHAHYVLDVQMARTPENVYAMMDELWTPALERAKAELEAMKAMMKEETGLDEFASWDWWYYAEKVRKRDYSLDESSLRPYFSLENVRSGIFELSNRLYGLTFRPVQLPVYHEECETYEVLDEKNEHLGVLYLDYHPRDGKSGGAWCGEYRPQSFDAEGNRIAPIVSIVCNFSRPSGGDPALLSIDETQTFFHEFGHALHNLFSQVKYSGLSGVERDFVELPSQIMENWALEPEMLRRYALHHRTNDPIPNHMIEKLQRSRHFNQGFNTVELLAASLTDMDIHTIENFAPIDVNEFERKMLNERRGLMEQIAPRYRYPYFSHIFDGGYSSGYYSYLWAEVLDKDAYQAFVESGDIFNKRIATDFRHKLLARGGEADGMDLYRAFRGADPDRKPLLIGRGLIEEEAPAEEEQIPTLTIEEM